MSSTLPSSMSAFDHLASFLFKVLLTVFLTFLPHYQGLKKWFVVSNRMKKFQRRVEDLEKELAGSEAAWRLAEPNDDASFKTAKIVEVQAVAAKSRLAATEIELEALCSRQICIP